MLAEDGSRIQCASKPATNVQGIFGLQLKERQREQRGTERHREEPREKREKREKRETKRKERHREKQRDTERHRETSRDVSILPHVKLPHPSTSYLYRVLARRLTFLHQEMHHTHFVFVGHQGRHHQRRCLTEVVQCVFIHVRQDHRDVCTC